MKKLPPTDANLQLHVLRADQQMLLSKAADQRDPPEETRDIANFCWSIDGAIITPTVSTAPVAPQALLDVVSCSCTAEGKACSGTRCTSDGGVGCFSRFTIKQMNSEDDEVSLSASDDDEEGQHHEYRQPLIAGNNVHNASIDVIIPCIRGIRFSHHVLRTVLMIH